MILSYFEDVGGGPEEIRGPQRESKSSSPLTEPLPVVEYFGSYWKKSQSIGGAVLVFSSSRLGFQISFSDARPLSQAQRQLGLY